MRLSFIILPLGLSLLACTEPPTGQSLPLMGGYRDPADQCVRVGENEFTNQFLDHTADLVGCPVGYEGTGVFVTETSAVLVAVADGYELYSVPRN
ncbi:hypothetical protein [Aliiruegeria lutimaris]|uniref:Uncharacterized protein n=1 Tax=Aliiruegeria lutimaris TaxID=571298 RepID=A0A1G9I9T8_9RHOB|nr:hypothetical protein [Aliiruegeria lutimaris]SDL21614.1 hypothetical protein SAMN04488026_10737 [Aliiruegeria lutimaris]